MENALGIFVLLLVPYFLIANTATVAFLAPYKHQSFQYEKYKIHRQCRHKMGSVFMFQARNNADVLKSTPEKVPNSLIQVLPLHVATTSTCLTPLISGILKHTSGLPTKASIESKPSDQSPLNSLMIMEKLKLSDLKTSTTCQTLSAICCLPEICGNSAASNLYSKTEHTLRDLVDANATLVE